MHQKLMTNDLCFSLNGKSLLNDISLEFGSGTLQGILGPNGSGKSTFLKVLTGIWKPTSGSILWNGEPLLKKSRQVISRILTLVPQNPQPSFDYLVHDIVAMGRYAYDKKYWNAADETPIVEALKAVDALHLRQRCINHISYGERQRVYIARALVTECPVLLLDEPTASLDVRHQIEIWELLKGIAEKGKIVIATTHDLTVAEKHCNHVAVINQGYCLGHGSFNNMMTPQILQDVFGLAEIPTKKDFISLLA